MAGKTEPAMQSKFIKEINKMETLNYKVLEGTGYNGYILGCSR